LFLFGSLKGEMAGFTVSSPVVSLSEVGWTFEEMTKELHNRLHWAKGKARVNSEA
jgi:hypothetical protein